MWTVFKVFIEFAVILFMFWFFGHEACGHLSSRSRDWTHTSCSGRWSLNHWTTKEGPGIFLIMINFGRRNSQQASLSLLLGFLMALILASLVTSDAYIVEVHPRAAVGFQLPCHGESSTHPGSSTFIWQDGQERTHPFRETVPRVARSWGDISVVSNEADGGLLSCSCGPQDACERCRQRVVLIVLAYPAQALTQKEGRNTWQRTSPSRGPRPPLSGTLLSTGWLCLVPSSACTLRMSWGVSSSLPPQNRHPHPSTLFLLVLHPVHYGPHWIPTLSSLLNSSQAPSELSNPITQALLKCNPEQSSQVYLPDFILQTLCPRWTGPLDVVSAFHLHAFSRALPLICISCLCFLPDHILRVIWGHLQVALSDL